jgi:hypothetical protein
MRSGSEAVWRRVDAVAVVGLLGWLAFDLTARTLFGAVAWPDSVVDYHILYDASRYVADTHRYPTAYPYPYPPPAAAVQAASAVLPFGAAAAVWLALTGCAAAASYFALARTLGLPRRPGALAALPLAHLAVAYYFQWDMRSVNCNLIVLAAVLFGCAALAAGRDAAAGFWFAAGVALKVFPVLVLPYLAWRKRWRALAWGVAFSAAFWGAVPLAAFGSGFADVYAGWAGELTRAADPAQQTHPILISLNKAAAHLAAGTAVPARVVVWAVCVLWVAVGLGGAAASRSSRPRDGFAALAHVSLLVLGPVAVNPYLEPYHLVPLAVPAVLVLAAALDGTQRAGVRVVAAVGFVLGLAILKASSPWALRGLLVNAQALVLCGAAVWVSWARAADPASAEAAGGEPAPRGRFAALVRRLARRVARPDPTRSTTPAVGR